MQNSETFISSDLSGSKSGGEGEIFAKSNSQTSKLHTNYQKKKCLQTSNLLKKIWSNQKFSHL